MANAALFTQHPLVVAAIDDVKRQCAGRALSDIIDDAGHQYETTRDDFIPGSSPHWSTRRLY